MYTLAVSSIVEPVMSEVDAPNTLWFLVIFVLFGLLIVAVAIVVVSVMSKKFHRVYSSGRYSCKHEHNLVG